MQQVHEDTKLGELTVGQLKHMLRDHMRGLVFAFVQQLPDPDEGKSLRPEIEEALNRQRQNPTDGEPIDDLLHELDLDE
jgi:hypothetical protein